MTLRTLRGPSFPWMTDAEYCRQLHSDGQRVANIVVLRDADPAGLFWPLTARAMLGLPAVREPLLVELSCGYDDLDLAGWPS